jgi:outer membrane protein insertion porin family
MNYLARIVQMLHQPPAAARWPSHRVQVAALAAVLAGPHIAVGQGVTPQGYPTQGNVPPGYSLGPELTQPLAGPAAATPGIGVSSTAPNLPPVPTAPQADGPRQLVVDVQIVGNRSTKEHEIQKHIQSRRDREFDSETVQADHRRLLQTGLFRDVTTKTQQVPGGVIVIFEVAERPRINYLRHLGNRGLSEKALIKEHGMKQGDPLNAFSTEEGRRKIEELYHRSGFPNATVSILEGNRKEDQGVVYVINEGQLERIEKVVFEGNTIATASRLRTQIESKPGYFWYFFGGKLDREKLDADVQKLTAYYRSLGFFRARIGRELEFDDAGKWVTVKYIIDEGPRYVIRNVSVEGNTKFASDPLLGQMQLKSGQFYNQGAMNRDLNTLVDLYGSQGHVFADVQADPRFLEEPGQLDLVYRIKEGDVFRVGEINVHIAGESPHTRQTVILNRLGLAVGDILDTRKIRDAERRLKSSQLFEVDPQIGEPPRIAIRPPDYSAVEGLAEGPRDGGTLRGQSPDERIPASGTAVRPAPPTAARPVTPVHSWEQLRGR